MEHGADPASGSERSGGPGWRSTPTASSPSTACRPARPSCRARACSAQFLEALLPSLVDDGDAAQALHDVAALRSYPLDDPGARSSRSARRSRGGRRCTSRAPIARRPSAPARSTISSPALEGEIKLAPTPAYRAALETERGGLYERAVGNLAAARQSYAAAVEINPSDVTALLALLRLALRDGDRAAAAAGCKKIADAVGDPRVKAEFLAWAGRLYDAVGLGARRRWRRRCRARCTRPSRRRCASCSSGSTPATTTRASSCAVVERGLRDGSVAAPAGWFDLGYLYRYRLGDAERAEKAFAEVVAPATARRRSAALGELSELAAARGDWARVVALELERLDDEERRGRARAPSWTRIGQVREERLDDADGAAEAYTKADRGRRQLPAGARRRGARVRQARHRRQAGVDASRRGGGGAVAGRARGGAGARGRAARRRSGDGRRGHRGARGGARRRCRRRARMFDALELALRRKGAYEKLCILYRSEVDRGVEPRRAAWLLHADRRAGGAAARRSASAPSRRSASRPASRATGRASRCRAWRSCSRTPTRRPSSRRCWRGWARSPTIRRAGVAARARRAAAGAARRRRGGAGELPARARAGAAGALGLRRGGPRLPPRRALAGSADAVRARHAAGRRAERAHYAYRAGLLARAQARAARRRHRAAARDHRARPQASRGARGAGGAVHRGGSAGSSSGRCSPSCRRRRRCWRGARRSPRPAGGTKRRLGCGRRRRPPGWRRRRPARRACWRGSARWNELAELVRGGAAQRRRRQARRIAAPLSRRRAAPRAARTAGARRRAPRRSRRRRSRLGAAAPGARARARRRRAGPRATRSRRWWRARAIRRCAWRSCRSWRRRCPRREVVATRLNQMALSPRDPVITVHIEQTLEARRNREGAGGAAARSAARSEERPAAAGVDGRAARRALRGARLAARGGRRLRGGARLAAAVAVGAAGAAAPLRRARRRGARRRRARAGWPTRCRPGAERAAVLRKLAAYHRDRGDSTAAIATLEERAAGAPARLRGAARARHPRLRRRAGAADRSAACAPSPPSRPARSARPSAPRSPCACCAPTAWRRRARCSSRCSPTTPRT